MYTPHSSVEVEWVQNQEKREMNFASHPWSNKEHAINVITVLVSLGYYLAVSFGTSSSSTVSTRGALIGYSSSGKPLYSLQDSMNLLNTNANLIKTFLVEGKRFLAQNT